MSVAHRYAAALLANVPAKPEALSAMQASVSALATALEQPAILGAVQNPRLKPSQRMQLATGCAKAADAPEALKAMLQLLAKQKRLYLLPEVLAAILAQMAAAQGITPVVVHTAVPLTDMQKVQLKMLIKQHTHAKDVTVKEVLKPALMGGFRAFFEGLVWDVSVGGRLARLKAQLKQAVQN